MENNEKKGKRGGFYERDLLKKVIREYRNAIAGVKSQFDLLISGALSGNGRKPVKIQPPDFVQIVLIPIVLKLSQMLPEYEVELKGKDEIKDHLFVTALRTSGILDRDSTKRAIEGILKDPRVEVHIRPIKKNYR